MHESTKTRLHAVCHCGAGTSAGAEISGRLICVCYGVLDILDQLYALQLNLEVSGPDHWTHRS